MFWKIAITVTLSCLAVGKVAAATDEEPQYLRLLPPLTKSPDFIYPDLSRRLDEEGVTQASFWIEKLGKTSRCAIVKSSGFPRLDAASCRAISKMIFTNSSGDALGPFLVPIRWKFDVSAIEDPKLIGIRVPSRGMNLTHDGELPPGRRVNLGLYLDVSPEGNVVGCKIRWGSDSPILDRRACDIASRWQYRFRKKGGTRNQEVLETFFFADPGATIPAD